MAFFEETFADIGDAQDLTKDLSSFSAHIRKLIGLLKNIEHRTGGGVSAHAGAPGRSYQFDGPRRGRGPG